MCRVPRPQRYGQRHANLWVTERVSQEPIEILKEHDYELQHRGLESALKLAEKQRDGIFSARPRR